ncbi:hypothetical protein, partial [Stenotrophomonas sp.]|uniref:hypothetical protein n=1 Tax=Stenotrophomonas sp. TaxID=69392 RepID=UPI0028AF4F02
VVNQRVQAGKRCGSFGHGKTLTGVRPPSARRWRTVRVGVPRQTNFKGEEGLADLAIPTHRPPLKAVGAFSQLRSLPKPLKLVRLFETPIPTKACCLGGVIIDPRKHGSQ